MRQIKVLTLVGVLLMVCLGLTTNWTQVRAQSGITLVYWRHTYEPGEALEKRLINEFEQQHPNIKVEMFVPGDSLVVHEKLLTAFAGGGKTPDIFLLDGPLFLQYVNAGFLDPVNLEVFEADSYEKLTEDWWPGGLAEWEFNDKYWGIPEEISNWAMYINRNHFIEAGLDPAKDYPHTWLKGDQSMAAVGQQLVQRKEGEITREALALPTSPEMALLFESLVYQLGDSIISQDGKTGRLDSEAAVRALQTLYDFVWTYEISAPLEPSGTELTYDVFGTGKSSMLVDVGSWYWGLLRDQYPDVFQNGNGVAVYPSPHFIDGSDTTSWYGYAWHVSAKSSHKQEAWEFVKFLSDHASQYLAETGLIQPMVGLEETRAAKEFPNFDLWMEQLERAKPFIGDLGVAQIIFEAMSASLSSAKTPPQVALKQANQKLNQYLQELPYSLMGE